MEGTETNEKAASELVLQSIPLMLGDREVCMVAVRSTGSYSSTDKETGVVSIKHSYEVLIPGMETYKVNSGPLTVAQAELRTFRDFKTGRVSLGLRLI
jgi:hypothetical protein